MNRLIGWQVASLGCAVAGIVVSGYLNAAHWDRRALVCGVGDCHAVQSSRYAEVNGIPVALLGLGMYAVVVVLGLLRWRYPAWRANATILAFAISLAGVLYVAYLTYLEVFVIEAICQWCVVSALLTVGLLGAEGEGVRVVLRSGT